jgi:hypothetical protein
MTAVIRLPAPNSRLHLVESGVLDQRAALAFTNGHCHSLALALRQEKGWPMIGLYRPEGECLHILGRRDDGALVDIGGARMQEDILVSEPGGEFREVDDDEVERLCRDVGWADPRPDLASAWVEGVVEHATAGGERVVASPFSTVFNRSDGLDLRVTWDGDTHLIAHVRETGSPTGMWVRCAAIPTPRDSVTGEYVIDFRAEAFAERAQLYADRYFDPAEARRKLADAPGRTNVEPPQR